MTQRRIFVLDTNVLMHDPASLYRFEEHDLYLPIAAKSCPSCVQPGVLSLG